VLENAEAVLYNNSVYTDSAFVKKARETNATPCTFNKPLILKAIYEEREHHFLKKFVKIPVLCWHYGAQVLFYYF
jgi:hypothetical protein